MGHRLHAWVHSNGDPTIVKPSGELDVGSRFELFASLRRCDGDVIVDLSEVAMLDASCIGVLAAERTRLTRHGCTLTLREPHGIVCTVLEVVGLTSWIADDDMRARPG